jgi:hypothetical protein
MTISIGMLMSLAMAGLWPAFSHADLTMIGRSVTGTANMSLSGQEKIWIRKTTVRRDFVDRGRAYTHLFDLAQRQAAIIDHMTRIAEVYDLSAVKAASEASAPAGGLKMSLEKTGNARPLRHWNCEEHTLTASMPARLGNEEAVFNLKGRLWVVAKVKELAEVKALADLAKKPGFFLGIPAVARVSPAQSVAISEIIRKLAPKGLLCSGEVESSYEGNGPMANLARRIPTRLSVEFQDFSADAIQPEFFFIPSGYQVVRK